MAILGEINSNDVLILDIIEDFINNRKYKFDYETIINFIINRAKEKNISNDFFKFTYFYVLVLNSLDKFVDNGKIYKFIKDKKTYYYPIDFLLFTDYYIAKTETRLLYFLNNNDDELINNFAKFIDVDTLEIINGKNVKKSDCILCGSYRKNRTRKTLQSDVNVKEISYLYHSFISEGAIKSEAINHVLNYYKAQELPSNLSWAHDFIIFKPKVKEKILIKK